MRVTTSMKVSTVYTKALFGKLTLSNTVQLLAEQPTRGEESHAHMHMRDGFTIKRTAIANKGKHYRDTKVADWSADSHLFLPGTSSPPPYEGLAYVGKSRVYQDVDRAAIPLREGATISKYSARSGLPKVPAVPEVRATQDYVKRLSPMGGRGGPTDVPLVDYSPTDGHRYVMSGQSVKVFHRSVLVTLTVPEKPATESHTMFEDSEAMVMHLAAALSSPAGIKMLWILYTRYHSQVDTDKTVGIFSKTSVYAVRSHIGRVSPSKPYPLALIRTADTDGNRHLLGTFTMTTSPIDHVVVVLGVKGTELTVITCFPCTQTTLATVGVATTNHEDLEEPTFGHPHKTPAMVGTKAPKLVW